MPAGPTPEELERAKHNNRTHCPIYEALVAQLEHLPRGSRIVITETGNYQLFVWPYLPRDDSRMELTD